MTLPNIYVLDINRMDYFASAAEAWNSVPFMSLHLPVMGAISFLDLFRTTTGIVLLVLVMNHSLNHSKAHAGNSRLFGFRKAVSGFWNTQTLERVHLKWRQLGARSVLNRDSELNDSSFNKYTNRLPFAWVSLSDVQGKTTVVWLSVLFFLLLGSNSFGLIPLCSRITGQAGFTLGMSIALLRSITYMGIRRQGSKFVRLFLPSGPSWPMAPLFILLESISYGFRRISLGTRLYCNMFRGHLLLHLFTSLSLVPVLTLPAFLGAPFTVIAAIILMALSALETIVAVLQAGVFCLLRGFYVTEVLRRKDRLAQAV
uniref:ATP synthase subunit a n=1 Tax=Hariotina sp. MMOGRB0030F TaxID=1867922 RepID=A0A1D6Z2D3_9CHLO|nr:ATP subunit 6 [Hariotina sp. MMOGRB0030F]